MFFSNKIEAIKFLRNDILENQGVEQIQDKDGINHIAIKRPFLAGLKNAKDFVEACESLKPVEKVNVEVEKPIGEWSVFLTNGAFSPEVIYGFATRWAAEDWLSHNYGVGYGLVVKLRKVYNNEH